MGDTKTAAAARLAAARTPEYTTDHWTDAVLDATAPRPNSAQRKPAEPKVTPSFVPTEPVKRGKSKPGSARSILLLVVLALLVSGIGLWLLNQNQGVTKASFIRAADTFCASTNASAAGLAKPTSYPELGVAASNLSTVTSSQVSRLGALPIPGGAAGQQAQVFVNSLGATSAAVLGVKDASAAPIDDAKTASASKELSSRFSTTDELARAYGFKSCGTGLKPGVDAVLGGTNHIVKAAFVAKADSLCRGGASAAAAVPPPRNNTPQESARALNASVAVLDKLTTDLKALIVPPGDEASIADLFAAQDKVNAKTHELRDAALRGDVATVIAAEKELSPLGTAVDAKWDAYGLAVCGSNFGG